MTVLVLDPRWPDMVPLDIAGRIRGPVEFTPEVPISVRWALADVPEGRPWTVTTEVPAGTDDVILVPSLGDPVWQAVHTMAQARRRGEWEQEMTHESLLPFLAEESAELAEAIRSRAPEGELKRELSDVLLQVLFHAQIAEERGAFNFADVAQAFVDKMRSRSPYLFDGSTGLVDKATQDRLWAEGKARERNVGD